MSPVIPAATSLSLGNPARLLEQLQGDVDPANLLSTAETASENPATVHYLVLRRVLTATSRDDAERLLPCLQRLVEIKAPLFADYPTPFWEHPMALFCEYPMPPALADVMRSYLAAGLLDANTALPGELSDDFEDQNRDTWPVDGLSPLAASIDKSNPEAVRVLCEFGASFDIGPVDKGSSKRWGALEFADANRDGQCRAVLVEAMMTRQVAVDATTSVPRVRRRL